MPKIRKEDSTKASLKKKVTHKTVTAKHKGQSTTKNLYKKLLNNQSASKPSDYYSDKTGVLGSSTEECVESTFRLSVDVDC